MDRYKIIRYFAYTIEILILYMVQETPGLLPEIGGARPVLLIPAAISIAMFESELAGIAFGLLCGLFLDIGMRFGFPRPAAGGRLLRGGAAHGGSDPDEFPDVPALGGRGGRWDFVPPMGIFLFALRLRVQRICAGHTVLAAHGVFLLYNAALLRIQPRFGPADPLKNGIAAGLACKMERGRSAGRHGPGPFGMKNRGRLEENGLGNGILKRGFLSSGTVPFPGRCLYAALLKKAPGGRLPVWNHGIE